MVAKRIYSHDPLSLEATPTFTFSVHRVFSIYSSLTKNDDFVNLKTVYRLTWSLPPTRLLELSLLSSLFVLSVLPAGLTSKPHHAQKHFCFLTWVVLPATGLDLQPQTRKQFASFYKPACKKSSSKSRFPYIKSAYENLRFYLV